MQDPMAMARAMMAMQQQAAQLVAEARADLAARGLGFGPELQQEVAAQAAAHPTPVYDPNDAANAAAAAHVAQQAMSAEYPEHGFDPADPRLEPIEGMSMPVAAIAARAVGWSTEPEFIARVAGALGFDAETYQRAGAAWRERVAADVVLAAFYGQLFSQA